MWTFFVLNLDKIYNNNAYTEVGVPPAVYLVPKDKLKDVEKCVKQVRNDYWSDNDNIPDLLLCESFEKYLNDNNIPFSIVGCIELPFGERKGDYLDKHISTGCV